jgi:hypothetical protein
MIALQKGAPGKLLIVVGVALVWVAFSRLNEFCFSFFAFSNRAHWIFLPAAVRILSVLLFDGLGAAGLMLGAYLTLPHEEISNLPIELLVSSSSAIAPLVAVAACRRWLCIAWDLSGLRGRHVVIVSVASAAANAFFLNLALFVADQTIGKGEQIVTVFVGDLLGTAIVLSGIVAVLSLTAPRTQRRI